MKVDEIIVRTIMTIIIIPILPVILIAIIIASTLEGNSFLGVVKTFRRYFTL